MFKKPFKRSPLKKSGSTTKSKLTDSLDKVFQYYIRLRDAFPGGLTKCISCGQIKPFEKMQGGHYLSRRHMSTRWSELNVNSECMSCNCMDGDHLLGYRRNLVKKIGEAKVEWLESYCNETRKWSDFELEEMIKLYSKKCEELSIEKGIRISVEVQRIIKRYSK